MAIGRLFWFTIGIITLGAVVCTSRCPDTCECFGDIVDCSDKHLLEIPHDIPDWVKELNIGKNSRLSIGNDSFSSLPKLNRLSLDNMKLKELPDLGEMVTLKKLSLSNNKLKDVSSAWLESMPSLHELVLTKNSISQLDPSQWQHPALRKIDLSGNPITSILSKPAFNLPALTSLRMSRNQIADDAFRNLTSLCSTLPNLKTLDLNRNSMHTLQGLMFQHLVNVTLRTLKLRRNELVQLPDGVFYGLHSLETLQLDNNANITEVSNGWLFGLSALKVLTLSHNKIGAITEKAWEDTKQLTVLDLSFNELGCRQIHPNFKGLYNLQELFISHNCLANLDPETFGYLSKLQTLDISHNQIQWSVEDSTGAFKSLTNLEYLNLAHNKIETIHNQVFEPLQSLTRLDLSGNNLKTLSQNPFKNLPRLSKLHFNTSSLVCNCHLVWLPTWLATQSFNSVLQANCGFPESLRGKSIFDLSPENFSCSVLPQPVISVSPKNETVLFGNNMTLECVARTGGDEPIFIWTKDREIEAPYRVKTFMSVEEDSLISSAPVYRVVSHLTVANITHEHAGSYQCIARNSFGPSYSDPAKIVVHRFPYFTRKPKSVAVKEGSAAELNCLADGFPSPEVSWKKEGDEFPAARERRLHYLAGDSVSFIKPVMPRDDGVYVCTAKNDAGSISISANVTVIHTPNFSRPLTNQSATTGQSVVLECQGTGRPKPAVTWLKDGKMIVPNENRILVDEGQFLLLLQVERKDGGSYHCELANALGAQRRNIILTVKEDKYTPSMTELIIIIVVVCVVVTSVFWVLVIYRTRQKSRRSYQDGDPSTPMQHVYQHHLNGGPKQTVLNKTDEIRNRTPLLPASHGLEPYTMNGGQDSSSEHSSGKDSGVGDSAHRSNEDLRKNLADVKSNIRQSLLMYPDSTSTLKSTIIAYGEPDDLKPRLSTFGMQHLDPSRTVNYNSTYASLRRGSASRLLAVPSPVMPSIGMSSLPRHAYRSHSGSLSHPKSRKVVGTGRTNSPMSRSVTPPVFLEKKTWEDDDITEGASLPKRAQTMNHIMRNAPLPNFYSEPNCPPALRREPTVESCEGPTQLLPAR